MENKVEELIKEIESWKNKKGDIVINANIWQFLKNKFEELNNKINGTLKLI